MDRNIKTSFKNVVDEYIVNRKAMFIPIAAVASWLCSSRQRKTWD